jgi:hypothetical protein
MNKPVTYSSPHPRLLRAMQKLVDESKSDDVRVEDLKKRLGTAEPVYPSGSVGKGKTSPGPTRTKPSA